jgi:hypothetical protein
MRGQSISRADHMGWSGKEHERGWSNSDQGNGEDDSLHRHYSIIVIIKFSLFFPNSLFLSFSSESSSSQSQIRLQKKKEDYT